MPDFLWNILKKIIRNNYILSNILWDIDIFIRYSITGKLKCLFNKEHTYVMMGSSVWFCERCGKLKTK